MERFVTLIETVKWNPLTWEFFNDLSDILRVGLINCFGLFVTLIIENQGKISEFSDKDFFIPPLIDHSNTSFNNLEKFVTLIETVKWNPLTWNFFTDLSHILRVGLGICFGLLVTLVIGVLIYFTVKLLYI